MLRDQFSGRCRRNTSYNYALTFRQMGLTYPSALVRSRLGLRSKSIVIAIANLSSALSLDLPRQRYRPQLDSLNIFITIIERPTRIYDYLTLYYNKTLQ